MAFVSAWFLLGGLGHFVFTDFFVGIVPPYVPWPLAAVWVSGVFELLGAAALLLPAWRRLAACGLFILTLCVTPANLYMWQHPDLFPSFPPTLLAARLALQAFLLGCILALMLARDEAPLAQR
ncbi:doxX-like family protein [Pseudomonas aeruginosa]|nr:doxX-like family protein [Pseudomonas aeruginosa]